MKEHLLQLKFEMRSLLAREPMLTLPNMLVVWWAQYKASKHIDIRECRVGKHTEIVIDGFQGSGNSFAIRAFKRSQTRPVMLAHHLHAPAQIIKSVHMGLPTLVTIREPVGAVLSLTSRWPFVSVQQALRSYTHFYEKIEPYTNGFVLSPFDQTTMHLDQVVQEVNRRFNTNFDLFAYSEADMLVLRNPKHLNSEEAVRHKALKAQKALEFENQDCSRLLSRAEAVYRRMEPLGTGIVDPNVRSTPSVK